MRRLFLQRLLGGSGFYRGSAVRGQSAARRLRSDGKGRDAWKEELKKGYFDDFGDFSKHRGKLFEASTELLSPEEAVPFPPTEFVAADSARIWFPGDLAAGAASVVCLSFREGARGMVASWAEAFRQAAPEGKCFKVHVVEHKLMRIWPFRNLILASAKTDPDVQNLFCFGDCGELCDALDVTNRLTAYVYLLDNKHRIRWRATGMPSRKEAQTFRQSCKTLMSEIP